MSHIDATITGELGTVFASGPDGKIRIHKVGYEVRVPALTGSHGGRRQHGPLTLTKSVDGTTPQFLHAMAHPERLQVMVEFFGQNQAGEEQVTFRITLGKARVVGIRLHTPEPGEREAGTVVELEDVSFRFSSILMESPLAGTVASDHG